MKEQFKSMECVSGGFKIFIAGDIQLAKNICQKFVERGACVNVVETEYIYKFGKEVGVIVEFINYPRFPKPPTELRLEAEQLAFDLAEGLSAGSFTISSYGWSTFKQNYNQFFSRRGDI